MKRFIHAFAISAVFLGAAFLMLAFGVAMVLLQEKIPNLFPFILFGGIFAVIFAWAWMSYEDKP